MILCWVFNEDADFDVNFKLFKFGQVPYKKKFIS